MKELFAVLQRVENLPELEIARFSELAKVKKIEKGSYFIREGYVGSKLGFVKKGLFRSLYLTEKGSECTFAFSSENDFLYECRAMRTFEVAQYSVQAIEQSIILEVDYKLWSEPFKDTAWWNKMLLDWTTAESSDKSAREISMMSLSNHERYQEFLLNHPHLENRLTQRIIASYLGITPVSLSRIRKEMGLIT